MAREEDILFCKIAVSNGLVTEENAQKCLAMCDRQQREGGRRPPVGAVLAKHGLLRQEDVRRLNEAVAKRLGQPVSAGVPPARSARGGRGRGERDDRPERGRGRGRRSGGGAPRQIDKATLWKGIAGGVAFLAIFGTTVVLLIRESRGKSTPEESAVAGSTATPTSGANQEVSLKSLFDKSPSGAAGSTAGGAGAPLSEIPVDAGFRDLHVDAIARARQVALVDNLPERAVAELEKFIAAHETDYKAGGGRLLDEARREVQALKGDPSQDSAGVEPPK
jgi:hypothetical protein